MIINEIDTEQIRIAILEVKGDTLRIDGHYYQPVGEEPYILEAVCGEDHIKADMHDITQRDIYDEEGELLYKGSIFSFDLPLKAGQSWLIHMLDASGNELGHKTGYSIKGKLGKRKKGSYYAAGRYILSLVGESIKVEKRTFRNHLKAELRFLKGTKGLKRKFKAMAYRIPAMIWRKHKKKPVWIISDRTYVAGDNGEAFFRYVMSLPEHKKINAYFLLEKDSRDFDRMKKIGKVLSPGTYKYKLRFLVADWIISSHADRWTFDAFINELPYVKDLYGYKYAFLQHGITKDDVSRWLWKQNRYIDLFVTAGRMEYQSILEGNYDYDESVVKLTGFPRFDRLENDQKKLIVFLPTWRRNLATDLIKGTSERPYSEDFKNSDYCVFYNKLINDERVIEAMKSKGYAGEFYIHPSSASQARDFHGNDTIEAKNETADYNRIFREASLIVTDFSSVAFDFAYLKKPIVYSQFDRDTFFEGHIYKQGYFSYEENGFGPVLVDYDDIVNAILAYIENDCVMEDKYRRRVDEFFAFTDKNNCKRVYEAILAKQ